MDWTGCRGVVGVTASYVAANDSARERLESLLDSLGTGDLRHTLNNGLTVATVLVHLAFWDRYVDDLLLQWQTNGFSKVKTNFGAVNAGVLAVAASVPDDAVAGMARSAAEAADRRSAGLPEDLVTTIESNGCGRLLERAAHRLQHLNQIADELGR